MSPTSFKARLEHVRRLYNLLDELELHLGGKRTLEGAHGRMDWPDRGVYFFFEPGQVRTTSGTGPRVTRVGTHALKACSKSTLWQRLSMHQGTIGGINPGGGNHRGSVFRLHVGTALINRDNWPSQVAGQWAVGSSAAREIRERERPLEQAVSDHIRAMPFLWLAVDDEPGPGSLRGYMERNAIALLSNCNPPQQPIDPPCAAWLGLHASHDAIHRSGLWNVTHVADRYDPEFPDCFGQCIWNAG